MIDLSNISLQFGGRYLFRNVNYKINSGDKVSLVGANGSGKSSLLKIIKGEIEPEKGNIRRQKKISIGYLPQENVTHSGKTLLDEAKSALTDIIYLQEKEVLITELLSRGNLTDEEGNDLVNQLGVLHHRLEELDSFSAESKVEKILTGLGFRQNDFERLTDEFSGGWQMRIALSKILISQNEIILLDEPTNHLDIDSLEWLIDYLKNYRNSLLIVSHDKYLINQVTNKTLEIYNGRFYNFNGSYNDYIKFKEERDKQAEAQLILQQKKIEDTEKFIERFRYKATKARQVQSRIKMLKKIELVDAPENLSEINIRFPEPPKSGRINIELISVSKSYGNNEIFSGINFHINRGDKIAFVGPNGAGKTTLAKILAGIAPVTQGERILGYNTIISYYAQDVADDLNPELDIIGTMEESSEGIPANQLRTLLGSFLFRGDDIFKKVAVLSGGEKSRVALAKMLLTKSNFLILDEPTNHLDFSSKEVLKNALINFAGSLVIVSHDVDFLSPIATKTVEMREGKIKVYEGGIDYYLSKHQQIPQNKEVHLQAENKSSAEGMTDNLSRKDLKKFEAELRQKKYSATKEIIQKISALEKRISDLERLEKQIESELGNPEIYSNPESAKFKNNEFKQVKAELAECLSNWENYSNELLEIEKQFSRNT
ncbi:MAG TPA: ABC-F family ATP-binding cassette domain-containing protein [Ignavibacteriaceae bacterium]|nr:ABC-F family ATP-binding cassette domain-containing protein [Ignavibacteriaceae bacterium]